MIALFRQRNFALLWTGGFISQTGDWLLLIGLPIAVYLLTGSALITSTVFIIELVPPLLLGPLAGVLVDRWDRRRIMIMVNLLQALVLLPLLAIHGKNDLWIVYVVSFVEALLGLLTGPAENALVPQLVGQEHVLQANSLAGLGAASARLIGSPLGGIIVGFGGLQGIVLLDAASFLIASILLAGLRLLPQATAPTTSEAAPPARASLWRDLREGLQAIGHNRRLMILFLSSGLQSIAQGVFLILYILFVLNILHGTTADVGLLRGVQAIGSLLGGIVVGSLGQRLPIARLFGMSAIAFGIVDLIIWNAPAIFPSLPLTVALFIVVGIPGVGIAASGMSYVQTAIGDAYRGRVFAALNTMNALLLAVGLAGAGALGDRLGVLPILNTQGMLYVLSGIIALIFLSARSQQGSSLAEPVAGSSMLNG